MSLIVSVPPQEYIESTDLAKKVSRWHESIGPRLERVERRAAFDVHEYGTHILAKFPGQPQQQQPEEEEQAQVCTKLTDGHFLFPEFGVLTHFTV